MSPLPIVVLISGTGSNLQAIIDAIAGKKINAEIRAVISNRPNAAGLQRARDAGIPTHVINHNDHKTRGEFDQALQRCIDQYQPQLVVLAGFMRILGDDFVRHYPGRMLNIHPSLLPEFPGLDTHRRALAAGHKQHGASVHFVTTELDGGPLLVQASVPVTADDTADSLQQKVHQQEHIIYPMAIAWIAEGRVQYDNNQIIFDGKPLSKPVQISASHAH
ncbi:MAG: phosphoribosylglycinamide formyltransferase [Gammaproteobacteria bacterium]|nr:phosphoribosylglycinamide formyltransferase [Gammaproteobacteria bacterium]